MIETSLPCTPEERTAHLQRLSDLLAEIYVESRQRDAALPIGAAVGAGEGDRCATSPVLSSSRRKRVPA